MKITTVLSFVAACGLAAPALAAPATAAAPTSATAVKLDDFACMVRTMYMAGAAENAAKKATDQTGRDTAAKISTDNYEAASFFIGKLSVTKVPLSKALFNGEVSGLAKFDSSALADQITQCTGRAQSERAAFINPLTAN